MRCNARMASIVLKPELVHFNLRNWTDTMPLNEEGFISRVSIRHSVSADAVRTILRALRSGGGTMAQFSHPEFGGMSQWLPGMTMVGDMFNGGLKSKLDAVCTELAAYVAETPSTDRDRGRDDGEVSYRSMRQRSDWWPTNLGTPSAVGAQNDLQYAVFPRHSKIGDQRPRPNRNIRYRQPPNLRSGPSAKRGPNADIHQPRWFGTGKGFAKGLRVDARVVVPNRADIGGN